MNWLASPKPLIIMAPMDGITHPAFRRFVKQVEPRAVVFSEFLSSTEAAKKPSLAKTMFRVYPDEQPVVIQLYGKNAQDFRIAAQLAEAQGAAGIDINMGCPAKKVVAHRHGSALMREIDLACDIIAQVKAAVSVPVTVKTRLGWEDESNLIPFALRLQEHGLDAITIHGRTYQQKFDGQARFEPIYALKQALSIPVFGNGDIDSPERAQARLGNLDGLMIGRAAVADPWLLQAVCDVVCTGKPATPVPFRDKVPFWKSFAAMSAADRDETAACRAFRKYLVGLVSENRRPELRSSAITAETLEQINELLDRLAEEPVEIP